MDHLARVLVIDDDADTVASLCDLLKFEGHEVHGVLNGHEGIRVALASRPDVVICDLGLPQIDGLAVARKLRQELGSDVTLVAFTGFTSPDHVLRSLEAGFDHHLSKPGDLDALAAILARAPSRPRPAATA